jgi:glycosyltransferase involved in cell wall biosynthesis
VNSWLNGTLGALHRHGWQRIPYAWRRRALFTATAAIAPKPAAGALAAAPVTVAGHMTAASGLGQAAQMCAAALHRSDPALETTPAIDIPSKFGFGGGSRPELKSDLKSNRGTLLVHVNGPLMPLAMLRIGAGTVAGKYVVGCWAWELPEVPDDWRHGVPFVHEIWAPSRFTAAAVARIAGGRPVRVVPYPVAGDVSGAADEAGDAPVISVRGAGDPFTVLTIFNMASGFARKNPLAAVAAFTAAFPDAAGGAGAARLIVKISNGAVYPDGLAQLEAAAAAAPPGTVRLLTGTLPRAELLGLYGRAHAMLSLHRSEGFGLTLAEAMLRGLPVVATDWSGNTDFLTPDTGCPVGYRLVPAVDPQLTYHYPDQVWADAAIGDAAAALRRLAADEPARRALGARARTYAREAFSIATYAARVAAAVRER